MKRFWMASVLVCLALAMVCGACAETAAPSITVGTLITPEGNEYADDFVVYVTPVVEDTVEAVAFEEVVKVFTEPTVSVKEYFGEEAVTAAVEFLPEEVDLETMQLDEFVPLQQSGYIEEYGEIKAVFEFATEYKEDDVLLAVIGILPEGYTGTMEDATAEGKILWIPVMTEVIEGKVQITLTQEVMVQIGQNASVMALLRAEEATELIGDPEATPEATPEA